MKVSAGSAANIKPELVLDAYYASLGEERPQFAFMTRERRSICRYSHCRRSRGWHT